MILSMVCEAAMRVSHELLIISGRICGEIFFV